jgi:hypothetical protein
LLFLFILLISLNSVSAFVDYVDNPTPSDGETEIDYSRIVSTCVDVSIPGQGCSVNLSFLENSGGSWVEYQSYSNITEKGTFCGNLSVECGSTYFWRVIAVFNCSGMVWVENHTYSFTTVDCPVSHVYPVDGSSDFCPCCLAICAKFTNLTGDLVKFTFQSNYTGSWQNLEPTRVAPANETYCLCVPEFVWFNYTYYWRVAYANDSGVQYSDVFHFTTAERAEDCPCGEGSGLIYIEEKWFFAAAVSGVFSFLVCVGLFMKYNKKR